jgi:hypothetical protein
MSISGLSKARLVRMHDVMTGYVERGEVPGLVKWSAGGARSTLISLEHRHLARALQCGATASFASPP